MKQSKRILVLFFIVSAVYVVGILSDNNSLKFLFKPLIMISLILYYLSAVKRRNKLFIGAMFFSFLGDIMLLYDSELFFMLGLVSFLVAHVLFITMVVKMLKTSTIKLKLVATLPFIISYASLLYILKDSLGSLLIPVIIYGLVISVFGMVSLLNYLTVKNSINSYLFIGAFLFVTSDSLLAINKFYDAQKYYPALVIVTYILAQYFICKFMITRDFVQKKTT